jgi:hypothetical protein
MLEDISPCRGVRKRSDPVMTSRVCPVDILADSQINASRRTWRRIGQEILTELFLIAHLART